MEVNDTHSALNRTRVARTIEPHSVDDVVHAVQQARKRGEALAVCVGLGIPAEPLFRSMGGQQFRAGATLLDMRQLDRTLGLDEGRGLLRVEAGITWPDVIRGYLVRADAAISPWGIRQKQIASRSAAPLPRTFTAAVSLQPHSSTISSRSTSSRARAKW